MSEIISKADLLNRNARELPEAVKTLKSGITIKVRALNGYNAMKAAGAEHADKVIIAVSHGLIDPKLKPSEVLDYINFNVEDANEITSEVGTLTKEFADAENQETEKAKKHS